MMFSVHWYHVHGCIRRYQRFLLQMNVCELSAVGLLMIHFQSRGSDFYSLFRTADFALVQSAVQLEDRIGNYLKSPG